MINLAVLLGTYIAFVGPVKEDCINSHPVTMSMEFSLYVITSYRIDIIVQVSLLLISLQPTIFIRVFSIQYT